MDSSQQISSNTATPVLACLSIGSNQGDRQQYLLNALNALADIPGCTLEKSSKFFQTPAWGNENQPSFLNAACGLLTEISPHSLLQEVQKIETNNQRIRTQKWGPRTLDIDIICFGNERISSQDLIIPHALFSERTFVLEPLAEIYPDLEIDGKTVSDWLDSLRLSAADEERPLD